MGISAAKTRIGGPMKPLIQEANGCITAGNGTTVEGFREQDPLRRVLEGEERDKTLRDGNKQPSDLPKKGKESDARWLCGNWPQRNRARELKLSTERKPDETSDESNYEGPPTACRRNFTSGQPCLKFGEIILITKPLIGLIPHQKLKGRFA